MSHSTVAIVTGSARNIGRAISLDFAKSGINIVLNGRSMSEELQAVHQDRERSYEAEVPGFL